MGRRSSLVAALLCAAFSVGIAAAEEGEASPLLRTARDPVSRGIYLVMWYELLPGQDSGWVTKQSFFAAVPYPSQRVDALRSLSPEYGVEEVTNHFVDGAYKLSLKGKVEVKAERTLFYGFGADVVQEPGLEFSYAGEDIPRKQRPPERFSSYLDMTDKYDYEAPAVAAAMKGILKGDPGYCETIRRVWAFVNNRVSYGAGPRPNTASSILAAGEGRCGEFSRLTVAMLRAAGIPARVVSTRAAEPWFSDSDHAWTEAYVPSLGWLPVQSQLDPPDDFRWPATYGSYFIMKRYADDDGEKWIHFTSYYGKGKFHRGHIGASVDLPAELRPAFEALLSSFLAGKPPADAVKKTLAFPPAARPLLLWALCSAPDAALASAAGKALVAEARAQGAAGSLASIKAMSPPSIREVIEAAAK